MVFIRWPHHRNKDESFQKNRVLAGELEEMLRTKLKADSQVSLRGVWG